MATLMILSFTVLFFAWLGPVAYGGAPFSPTSRRLAEIAAEEALPFRTVDRVADLGSGTGTVLLAFARCGWSVQGFEINPILARIANHRIEQAGLTNRARVVKADFWKSDLSGYDVVFVFQVGLVMRKLEMKLRRELSPGSCVISNRWRFPGLPLVAHRNGLWIYRMP